MKAKLKKIMPYAGFLILFILFTATTQGRFATLKNLRIIVTQSMITMVAACGTMFVMAHNNLDFSLGGGCALCTAFAYMIVGGENLPLLFLCCIVLGTCCGLITSVIHIKGRIPAFMAGMCIMFTGRGVSDSVVGRKGMYLKSAESLANIQFYLVVLIIVFVIGVILFNYTRIGKYQKLIGSNPNASVLNGININKYKAIAFVISGMTLGIASFLMMLRLGGVTATIGTNLEIDVLISLCLGGMSMTGGSSSRMRSAIIGPLTYFMLSNGLTMWGVEAHLVFVLRAVVFLLAVLVSIDRSNKKIIL